MLEAAHLSAAYGPVRALDDVSLTVGQGEVMAVLGANGAGKSTLLRTLVGLMPGAGGSIRFLGEDIRPQKAAE